MNIYPKHGYWGIVCQAKDEKALIKRINDYLAEHKRVLSKSASRGLLTNYLPFEYKYFYWNLNKAVATFTALIPNQDRRGEWREPEYRDCGWLLSVRINDDMFDAAPEQTRQFLDGLFAAVGCAVRLIEACDDRDAAPRWSLT